MVIVYNFCKANITWSEHDVSTHIFCSVPFTAMDLLENTMRCMKITLQYLTWFSNVDFLVSQNLCKPRYIILSSVLVNCELEDVVTEPLALIVFT